MTTPAKERSRKRILAEVSIGLLIFESINHLYDWVFFPFALIYWGPIYGALIATGGAFLLNIFVFWLYEEMKVDWLLARTVRELADKENKQALEKFVTWIHTPKAKLREKLMVPLVFIALTYPIDPVIVAIHYRKRHFEGITLRDWLLLFAATLSACALWLLTWEPGALLIKIVWHFLFSGIL